MTAPARARRPGWLRLVPFLFDPPPLTERQWRVLGLVSLVTLFEQYDVYLFSLNLAHIQRELGIAEAHVGWLGSLVRAGALGAVAVTLLADRHGRRRLLLVTVLAYTLLTGATALAPNATWFVVCQFGARIFAAAEGLLAIVVIAEEFDAAHRGWGIGALGAISACGAGLAALAFTLVDVLPFGWRALYAFGVAPLVALAWWRRSMPETERFAALERSRRETLRVTPALAPLGALVRRYPGRLVPLAVAVGLLSLAFAPASFFAPKYLQEVHGWSPGGIGALTFFGGFFAVIANPLAGRLSDRRGRRPIAAAFTTMAGLFIVLLYGTGGSLLVGAWWAAMIFGFMGAEVTLAAFGAEMFPTSYRSTASGLRTLVSTLGTVGGLAAVSLLYPLVGSNWIALAILGTAALVVPFLIWAFPETAQRSLEEIAPEPTAGR